MHARAARSSSFRDAYGQGRALQFKGIQLNTQFFWEIYIYIMFYITYSKNRLLN
jgi:hypothetical protein